MKKIKGKHAEISLEELVNMQPCMSRIMREYTERYSIMYHAAKTGNWRLALYELKEIREIADIGGKTRPKWAKELKDFDQEYLAPIEKAMKAQNWEAFEEAYMRSTKACNEIHKRIGYHYIKYKLPGNPPDWLDLHP